MPLMMIIIITMTMMMLRVVVVVVRATPSIDGVTHKGLVRVKGAEIRI